ncbi:hypothetical protein RF11_12014 [Thelohanellus kitauei]|uniref:ISXO2-like transposase domain-containing protein n=1 Tax=Thelohanellus kitauei TaxID=669202 RepID=A0A0C2MPC3_THEKT|nr:hypothetical protein RF11_12014 [Thelohanellus kitauei]
MFEYFCLPGAKNKQIEVYIGNSKFTVTLFKKYLRQLVVDSLDFIYLQIGGNGVVVEIDETKIGNNKHYMKNPINGAWTHGCVERTDERRVFLVVPDRTEATLLDIIRTHLSQDV